MSFFKKSVFTVLAFFGLIEQANAAFITETFDFTASGIMSDEPIYTPPTDPIIGSFTLTRDTSLLNSQGSVTVNSLNTPLDYPLSYKYETNFGGSELDIATYIGNSGLIFIPNQNTFRLILDDVATANLRLTDVTYTRSGFPGAFFGIGGGTVTERISGVSAVPLPASLPLFAAAIIGLGALGLYRRRSTSAYIS